MTFQEPITRSLHPNCTLKTLPGTHLSELYGSIPPGIRHLKEIRKLTFRSLALRRSESSNCGLCVVYIQKDGATLLVGGWQHEK